jgi:hypothetical protein
LELLRQQIVAWFKDTYPALIYARFCSHDQKYLEVLKEKHALPELMGFSSPFSSPPFYFYILKIAAF